MAFNIYVRGVLNQSMFMDKDSWERFHKKMKELNEQEKQYKLKYGSVKPILRTSIKERRFVAIGNEVHFSDNWNTFPDFLLTYIWSVFTKKWGEEEIKRDSVSQHEVIKWWLNTREFISKQKVNNDGLCESLPNGSFSAILLLAYDLYLIRHHQKLQELVINRLKDPNQFQGVRYELFALSSCIRAGFNIEFEDETNRKSKHAEFTAINKESGDKISIEAKSKHRSGILGYKSEKGIDKKIKIKVVQLINQAIKKKSILPLVIFIDTNLPQDFAEKIYNDREFKEFKKIMDRVPKEEHKTDKFNLIIFTNTPHYYKGHELVDSKKHYSHIFSLNPETKIVNTKILHNLNRAVSLYGNVPNEFPDYDRTF